MTVTQVVSLVLLGAALGLSMWRRINIGLVAFAATLVLMQVSGTSAKTAFGAFPASLAVLIIGVTLLFAHAERSGAVQWLVGKAIRLTGGNRIVVPWAGFAIGAAMSTIGAFPTAPISLLLPMLARIAQRNSLNYTPLAVVCVLGSNAAGLSPLSPAGALIRTIATKHHVHYSPWELYGAVLALHVVVCAALLAVYSLRSDARTLRYEDLPNGIPITDGVKSGEVDRAGLIPCLADEPSNHADRRYRVASLISLVLFVVLVLVFQLDVGLTALALAFLLQLLFRGDEKALLAAVPWNVVLLLSGLVVYLGMLDTVGTLKAVESSLGNISSRILLIFVLCYIAGIIANVESSTLVVLGVMIPVGLGVMAGSASVVFAVMVAVTVSAAVVVMNPLHIAGALIIANTPEEDQTGRFQRLLLLGASLTVVVPGLVALYPVLVLRVVS